MTSEPVCSPQLMATSKPQWNQRLAERRHYGVQFKSPQGQFPDVPPVQRRSSGDWRLCAARYSQNWAELTPLSPRHWLANNKVRTGRVRNPQRYQRGCLNQRSTGVLIAVMKLALAGFLSSAGNFNDFSPAERERKNIVCAARCRVIFAFFYF